MKENEVSVCFNTSCIGESKRVSKYTSKRCRDSRWNKLFFLIMLISFLILIMKKINKILIFFKKTNQFQSQFKICIDSRWSRQGFLFNNVNFIFIFIKKLTLFWIIYEKILHFQAQLQLLSSLHEDIYCRYSLCCTKLKQHMSQLLLSETPNVVHMHRYFNRKKENNIFLPEPKDKIISCYKVNQCVKRLFTAATAFSRAERPYTFFLHKTHHDFFENTK